MSGQFPIWLDQSPRVIFEAKSYISRSEAAIERAQKNQSNSDIPGQRWYAVPRVGDGGQMPTMREYLDEQARKRGDTEVVDPRSRQSLSSLLGPVLSEEI